MRRLAPPFAIFAAGSIAGALIVFAGLFVRRPLWSGAGLAAIALFGSTLFAGTLKPELRPKFIAYGIGETTVDADQIHGHKRATLGPGVFDDKRLGPQFTAKLLTLAPAVQSGYLRSV